MAGMNIQKLVLNLIHGNGLAEPLRIPNRHFWLIDLDCAERELEGKVQELMARVEYHLLSNRETVSPSEEIEYQATWLNLYITCQGKLFNLIATYRKGPALPFIIKDKDSEEVNYYLQESVNRTKQAKLANGRFPELVGPNWLEDFISSYDKESNALGMALPDLIKDKGIAILKQGVQDGFGGLHAVDSPDWLESRQGQYYTMCRDAEGKADKGTPCAIKADFIKEMVKAFA